MNIRRFYSPGQIVFITQVVKDRQRLFDEKSMIDLLRLVFHKAQDYHPFSMMAYVFLPDHFHLLIKPQGDANFSQINKVLLDHTDMAELRRFDKAVENLQATYLVQCPDETALAALMDRLHDEFPRAEFTFVEQDNTLGA